MEKKAPIISEIAYRTWCIDEYGLDTLFLLEGSEKALLIDTGTGTFDVPSLVKHLTDKPLIVAVTHGHLDHVGGMSMFPQIYIHPDDMDMARGISVKERKAYTDLMTLGNNNQYGLSSDDLTEGRLPEMLGIREGDTIHLGKRDVEVYETPGHTPGSISFLDRKERILFTGDACNPNTLLAIGGKYEERPKSDVSDLLTSAKKIENLKEYYDRNYNGHTGGARKNEFIPMPECITRNCIEACEGLLNGTMQGKKADVPTVIPQEVIEKIGKDKAEYIWERFMRTSCRILQHGEVTIQFFNEQVK